VDCLIFGNSMDFFVCIEKKNVRLLLCNLIWHVMHVPCKIVLQGHLLSLSCCKVICLVFLVMLSVSTILWFLQLLEPGRYTWLLKALNGLLMLLPQVPEELYTAPTEFLEFLYVKAAVSHTHACLCIGLACMNACIRLGKMLLIYFLMNPISFF